MSEESFRTLITLDNSFAPKLSFAFNRRMVAKFKRNCLTQDNVYFTHRNVVNLFLYDLDTWSRNLNMDFTLGDCFFGAVKLAKNPDPDKYWYSGYGIRYHLR